MRDFFFEIKNGIAENIYQMTNGTVDIYFEPPDNLPSGKESVLIEMIDVTDIPMLGDIRQKRVAMNVNYFPVSADKLTTEQATRAANAIGECMEYIRLTRYSDDGITIKEDRTRHGRNINTRVVDGIVQVQASYDLFLTEVKELRPVHSCDSEFRSK